MSSTSNGVSTDWGWKTYMAATARALPAVACWLFLRIKVMPALLMLQDKAGWRPGEWTGIELDNINRFVFGSVLMPVVVVTAILLLLEWRGGAWPRYRRPVLGTTVWVFNALVFFVMLVLLVETILLCGQILGQK